MMFTHPNSPSLDLFHRELCVQKEAICIYLEQKAIWSFLPYYDEKPRIFLFSPRPHLIIAKHFIISELVFSRPHVRPHLTPHVRPHVRPHTLSNVEC